MWSHLVLFSLLFLAFTSKAKALLGAQDPEPLLDINGEKVLSGTPYYIVSAIRGGGGGGLSLSPGRNLCPLDVIQQPSDLNRGQPLILSPVDGDGIVYESIDLNIKFSALATICFQPTVWKVDNYDNSTGQWFITTDGVEGNPGPTTLLNWFKFEKVAAGTTNSYRIVHCPKVCDSCVTLCSAVGIYYFDGKRHLALSRNPGFFMINFIKADEYNLLANRKILA